jgi:hypothetical protein
MSSCLRLFTSRAARAATDTVVETDDPAVAPGDDGRSSTSPVV